MISALLAALLPLALGTHSAAQSGAPDSGEPHPAAERAGGAVATELLVRDRAHAVTEALDALATDLDSGAWRVRLAALDVLARTRDGDPLRIRDLVLRGLRDPHPNVRARAVHAAGLRRIDPGIELWEALVVDALPATRLALIRALALVRPVAAGTYLTRLAQDNDPRVADAAFLALIALGNEASAACAAEWRRRELGSDGLALLDATGALASGSCADQLFLALEPNAAPAELALLTAAQARVCGTADPRALLAGWFAPFPGDDAISSLRRRAQLLAGAEALGATVLPHLIRDLQALDRWRQGHEADLASRRPRLAERLRSGAVGADECYADWVEAALGAARGDGSALIELFHSLSDGGYVSFVESAYGRLDALKPPPRMRSIGEQRDRGRSARFVMTELAGEIYARTGDEGAGAWLALALTDDDPACRREAAYALSRVPDLRPRQDDLYAAWRRMGPDTRLEWLPHFSRRYALPSFRDAWIALWEDGVREVSILELLGAFEGDAELIERATVWMRRELRRLEQAAGGEPAGQAASEGLTKACVLALARMGADESAFLEALQRAEPLSEEVAKVAAGQLGKTSRGREMLLPWLAPARPQRLRLEAALALAPTGNSAAVEVLVTGYANCDEELQVRILRALGASESEAGWTLPLRIAAEREAGAGARLVAYEVLGAARPADRSARALLGLAASGRDLEGRRLALRALRNTRSPSALPGLAQLHSAGLDHESLREEWLVAAASCSVDGPLDWWLQVWSRRLGSRAIAELGTRFRGERAAAVEFTYRPELESARIFAARADELLAAGGAWWRGDARWLRELAETWWAAEDPVAQVAASRVVRAAEVALLGEGSADDSGRVRAELALRALAAARAERRHELTARRAEELLLDRRLGRLRPRDWERAFGSVDLATGRDPRAQLQVLVHTSRGRAALLARDLPAARAALARAEAERGDSEAARRDCAQLARAIQDADQ